MPPTETTATAVEAPSRPRDSLLAALGVVGMSGIEPVLLGSLISGDPLLLIGPHGTGKSYLLERIARALGLEWRHYNASLLNFDDLVGYPLPDREGGLRYVQTPSSIWGAEAVLIDEISRCRPDIQNKLFPVIHERRVQGLLLDRLRYRWSAMNPPASDDDDSPAYIGSEPLDLALADRFAFVVAMPDWQQLSEQEREALVVGSGAEVDPEAASQLSALIARGKKCYEDILHEQAGTLSVYVRLVVDLVSAAGILLSGRRAALLLRNIAAVHGARLALDPDAAAGDSALLALIHSLPQPASGVRVDELKVLACHREAWRLAAVPADDLMRQILSEPDPLRRALRAARLARLKPRDFSSVVADAVASLPAGGQHALATELFESGAAGRLVAAVADQCGQLYAAVCTPQDVHEAVGARGDRHRVWQAIESVLARHDPSSTETVLLTNLLASLFNAQLLASPDDVDAAVRSWHSARSAARNPA